MANNKFTFYESYLQMLEPLSTAKEKLELLMSVIKYALYGEAPNIKGDLLSVFLAIKPKIDNDQKRREINRSNKIGKTTTNNNETERNGTNKNEMERNGTNKNEMERNGTKWNEQKRMLTDARAQEREKEIEKEIEIDIEREKEIDIQKSPPLVKAGETLSLSQQKFKNNFPNKNVELKSIEDKKIDLNINIDKLIESIKQSNFLLNSDNLDLSWCYSHYEEIIAGKYKNFKNKSLDPIAIHTRQYTKEELDNIFTNIEDCVI